MSSKYDEDDLLLLSGIQHFAYCPRQWALIHIEQQWNDSLSTIEGKQLHERVDNPYFFEARGDILIARSVPISSYKLGFYGISDVIEFHAVKQNGLVLLDHPGLWMPVPIEYKRGRPKEDIFDEIQLCAQAMCIEEMLYVEIKHGYIFYGKTKHRYKVLFKSILRHRVENLSSQMHKLFYEGITPSANKKSEDCKYCSLVNICLPKLGKKKLKVESYVTKYLE